MSRQGQLRAYVDWWRTYGDVFRVRLGPKTIHVFAQPDHVRHIHVTNQKNYCKGFGYSKLKHLLGNGILISEGDLWRRHRRMMQALFTSDAVLRFAGTVTHACEEMFSGWEQRCAGGAPLAIHFEMMKLTMSIIGRTMLSSEVSSEATATGAAFTCALEFIAARTVRPIDWPLAIPTPANLRFKKSIRRIDDLIYRIIEARQSEAECPDDLLTALLHPREREEGEDMSQKQLRDEIMTIFFAGHETTALVLTWAWTLLSKNPHVEARLWDEVDSVLGGRPPSADDLGRLPYTRMVFEESMRLYPPVWAFVRDAIDDDVIGGYRIPAGSMVLTSQYITHRHPDFWDDPDRFVPERFEESRVAQRHPFAYFPFGVGSRTCLGNHFAMMEGVIALAMIAQRYRLRLADGATVEPIAMGTLRPVGVVPMQVEPRS